MSYDKNKRDKLIEAAAWEFLKHGYHNTTLNNIAHAANIPLGNVYYYFKTKEELLQQAIIKWKLKVYKDYSYGTFRMSPEEVLVLDRKRDRHE